MPSGRSSGRPTPLSAPREKKAAGLDASQGTDVSGGCRTAVPLSLREMRHLFWRLVLATGQRAERVRAWSAWRRWHQGIAQYWPYKRRAIIQLQL